MREHELCWASHEDHDCYRPYGHDGPHICGACGFSWYGLDPVIEAPGDVR